MISKMGKNKFFIPAMTLGQIASRERQTGLLKRTENFGPFPYATVGDLSKERPRIRVKAWRIPNELWRVA